jgi:Spy/CpxP family protein refolding chaperone
MKFSLFRTIFVLGFAVVGVLTGNAVAQDAAQSSAPNQQATMDEQIKLLKQDIRSHRKQLVAANMYLTEADATKFWPVYDQYVSEVLKANDAELRLIREYLESKSESEEQVDTLAKKWLQEDESMVALRLKYYPAFRKVISAKSTARFFQIDRRVQMMIDLQLAAQIPLVEPKM